MRAGFNDPFVNIKAGFSVLSFKAKFFGNLSIIYQNELDIDQIDYQKEKGAGLKSLMLKTYSGLDSNAVSDKELPIYFAERLANNYLSDRQI